MKKVDCVVLVTIFSKLANLGIRYIVTSFEETSNENDVTVTIFYLVSNGRYSTLST
jgi:hypothetical protein